MSQKSIGLVPVSFLLCNSTWGFIKCFAVIPKGLYQYLGIPIITYKELQNIMPQNGNVFWPELKREPELYMHRKPD